MGAMVPLHGCPPPLNPDNKVVGGFIREPWSLIGEDGDIIDYNYQMNMKHLEKVCWDKDMRRLYNNGVRSGVLMRQYMRTNNLTAAKGKSRG